MALSFARETLIATKFARNGIFLALFKTRNFWGRWRSNLQTPLECLAGQRKVNLRSVRDCADSSHARISEKYKIRAVRGGSVCEDVGNTRAMQGARRLGVFKNAVAPAQAGACLTLLHLTPGAAPACAGATRASRLRVKKSLSYSVPLCFILFDEVHGLPSPDSCRTRRCASTPGGYHSTGRE